MSVADPIADMLTRIRNAARVNIKSVAMPGSKLKLEILNRLVEEGYVTSVEFESDEKQGKLTAILKYDENEESVIDGIKRLSKQGRRVYVKSTEIPTERNGFGTVILSTSKGVITGTKAKELGVGGEVLCSVW